MKAFNLLFLTRSHDPETMSLLLQELAGLHKDKTISQHEAASLRALADHLTRGATSSLRESPEWIPLFEGFYFSYIIEHIGKEFDLLKVSSDGKCALNIELKSEDIGETRIKKQLEQNRYYLSHAFDSIFSFTYVMDTATLYSLNEKGYLKTCAAADLIRVLQRPALADCLTEGLDRFFRSSDYLISPVAAPEKFLQGQYFLTNQQFDFKRKILECLRESECPVISVTGTAGTGKTLLLFDLAMKLSEKSKVLLLHSGPLRQGHIKINQRLKNVDIRSAVHPSPNESPALPAGRAVGSEHKEYTPSTAISDQNIPADYSVVLIDEADHLDTDTLRHILETASANVLPVVLAYDPHQMLEELIPEHPSSETAQLIEQCSTLSLAFTGNIRINRPVYHFLRTLLHLKDRAGHPDYSCIDVLYANNASELSQMVHFYTGRGYKWIRTQAAQNSVNVVIAQEYEKVLIVLDEQYYYDENGHLCVKGSDEGEIRLLYEGLSRTRDSLCLIIKADPELFTAILKIRLQRG